MWKNLTYIFQCSGDARKLALRDKLRNIGMGKNKIIVQYPSRFTQVRDEIGGVRENVPSYEILIVALLSLPKSWHNIGLISPDPGVSYLYQ